MSDLYERFPDMKPVTRAPAMHTINGIGTVVYGSRDHDPETGTYVKTLWITLVFIPIFPIGAYRVADAAGGGWYFLGKVPVSAVAKGWSLALVLAIVGTIGYFSYQSHIHSPAYQAGRQLAEAAQLRDQGKLAQAAERYREVADGPTEKSADAVRAVTDMLDNRDLQTGGDAREMAGVFRTAYALRDKPGAATNLFERGLRFATERAEDSPDGCLAVLDAVEPAADDPAAARPLKEKILDRLVAQQPDQVEFLSQLAVVYEQTDRLDRCQALLEPHVKRLGTSEGARVLGLIYYQQGKHDEALALLEPYADKGLQALHQAENQYHAAFESFQQVVVQQLEADKAPGFDHARFKREPEPQRRAMLQEYFARRARENAGLARKQEELARRQVVVPVALDLGMLRLSRAQRLADPAERKAELERAEKTFLSVRQSAGGQVEFKIGMGKVYYWLGRPADGRKEFDEMLQASGRTARSLLLVADQLRELGSMGEARTLIEEAYNQAGTEQKVRQTAAALRAMTSKDLDDEILWLDRADANVPQIKASSAEARGQKAERDGNDGAAAILYREAIAVYAAQPESTATLNNGGLASLRLYHVTGERQTLEQAARKLEKALTLKPDDGIVAENIAALRLAAAVADLIGDRMDFTRLKRQADLGDLAYLYGDSAGRRALVRRARENAAIIKVRAPFDRALLLAPNNVELYSSYGNLLSFLGERDSLAALEHKAAEAHIDWKDQREQLRDLETGKKDESTRRDTSAAADHAERRLGEARKAGGATFAVAAGTLVRARIAQAAWVPTVDTDALVKLAEEADQAAPSAGTRSTLQDALLARAHRNLAAQQPDYAALADRTRRTLGGAYLLAAVLGREGKLRDAVLADPDVRRTLELLRGEVALLVEDPNAWAWAMLRPAHAGDAARVAQALTSNELFPLERALESRLSPPSTTTALRQGWVLEAAGKHGEARDFWKHCVAEGVALPFEVP